jgi:hypothetical protein
LEFAQTLPGVAVLGTLAPNDGGFDKDVHCTRRRRNTVKLVREGRVHLPGGKAIALTIREENLDGASGGVTDDDDFFACIKVNPGVRVLEEGHVFRSGSVVARETLEQNTFTRDENVGDAIRVFEDNLDGTSVQGRIGDPPDDFFAVGKHLFLLSH